MDTDKILDMLCDSAKRNDEINKRLVNALVIAVITFCVAGTICFGIMYLSDYTTTNMQQQQTNDGSMQQQQN